MTTANTTPSASAAHYVPPTLTLYCGDEDVSDAWRVSVMTWGANGDPSMLVVERVMGTHSASDAMGRVEDFDDGSYCGTQWRLVQEVGGEQTELFYGRCGMEQSLVQSQPDQEAFSLTIYGPERELEGKPVLGAWYPLASVDDKYIAGSIGSGDCVRASAFQTYLPCVFNDNGRPNAAPLPAWALSTSAAAGAAFAHPGRIFPRDSGNDVIPRKWTAYMAVRSLIEWFDNYETISASAEWAAIESMLAGVELSNLDVTGKPLSEALTAILRPLGFGWRLTPWRVNERHVFHVYSLHSPTHLVRPTLAVIGQSITSDANRSAQVNRLHYARDSHNIANEIVVVGDQYRTERSLVYAYSESDLSPAWDTTTHPLESYMRDGEVGGPGNAWTDENAFRNFLAAYQNVTDTNRHVFRTFVWNEDGRWKDADATVPNLSVYGLSGADAGQVVRRPRPVCERFSEYDPATDTHAPATVEIRVAGDDSTRVKLPGCRVLHDCAGFTVTEPKLWQFRPFAQTKREADSDPWATCRYWTWLTILYDIIRGEGSHLCEIYLTGSIECDRTLVGLAERSKESAWPVTARKIIEARDRYHYRSVGDLTWDAIDADTVDDSEAAATDAARKQDALEDAVGHGSIVLRGIHRTYAPGDGIDRTAGREVDLTVAPGGKGKSATAPIISGVTWQFAEGAYRTELTLDTKALQVVT
jgi:hypothetical protein